MKNVVDNIESETKLLTKDDYVLVIGGTNDIHSQCDIEHIVKDLENKLKHLCHTNIVISSVPFRYDTPYLNSKIRNMNKKLKQLTFKYSHIDLLELYNLKKDDYTTFGLHLNNFGKLKICQNLCKILYKPKEFPIDIRITNRQSKDSLLNYTRNKPQQIISHPDKDWNAPFSKRKYKPNYTGNRTSRQDFILPTFNKYDVLHKEEEKKEGKQTRSETKNQRRTPRKNTQNKHTPAFGREIKISVFSDSQGRDVWLHLDQINNLELKTSAVVLPGAPLLHVVDSALGLQSTTKHANEIVVLLGGTNDTVEGDFSGIYESLEKKLAALDEHTPVLLSTIPKRHDKDILDPINIKILQVNDYLQKVVAHLKQTRIIDLDELERYHFDRSGFHLNRKGKKNFAHLIIHELESIFGQPVRKDTLIKNVFNSSPRNSKIKITEKDMKDVIHDTRTEVDTVYAHCVSGDFFMGAGVAVIMREQFGRPSASDYISSHLTFQKTSHGASVYSLVTKPKYYMKPKICDYDLAFDQMVEDFKEKGLKKLICSPLGCVRDRINPYIFTKRLVQFQKDTGAAVEIISYSQNSERELLRNGLPHEEFLQRLVCDINIHDLQESPNSAPNLASSSFTTPTRLPIKQKLLTPLINQSYHGSSSLQQDPLVVPGVLTFSEVLKQSSENSVMISSDNKKKSFLDFNTHNNYAALQRHQEHVINTSEIAAVTTPLTFRQDKSYSEAARHIDYITHSFLDPSSLHNIKLC
jgi:hypothetical protein